MPGSIARPIQPACARAARHSPPSGPDSAAGPRSASATSRPRAARPGAVGARAGKSWKDGTRALALEPHALLIRLCATVPPPWFDMVRYFGVLSSHSRHRARMVASLVDLVDPSRFAPEAAPGDQLELGFSSGAGTDTAPRHARSSWGWLLRHVFRADVDTYPRCGGPMRWVEAATERAAISRLLAKHGLAPGPPAERRASGAPRQLPLSAQNSRPNAAAAIRLFADNGRR
jgi:hypothetical protein